MTEDNDTRANRSTRLLTTDDVIRCVKVTPQTIYRLIRTGELPAVRVGQRWRIRQSDLDGWLQRQRTTLSTGA